ncbi:MAG TPA: hypothetical protein ENN21_09390, partial [Spirochaetes bacterium]|nr:hypothetical protein [Spirochaetota bacterium]
MALTIAAVLVPFAAMAESVFLKDGSIVEGTVLNETKDELTLETSAGLKMQVPAKLILRKAASDEYKKRVFLYIKNGKEIEGHIVHRGNGLLLVRKDLQKPDELRIAKEEVLEISATRKDAAPKVYTPQYAAQISLIPLRSGSFLLGTDWLGVSFCFLKTGSLVVPLSLVMANMSFGGNTSDSPGESSSSSSDLLQNKTYKTLVFASLGAWVVFTAADALYSY